MKIINTKKYAQKHFNILDGKSNERARIFLRNIIPKTPGFFKDENWSNVKQIWDTFDKLGLNWEIVSAEYTYDEQGQQTGKIWTFEIEFINNSGRPAVVQGHVRAVFAGNMQDPTDRYDLTTVVY